MSTQKKCGFTGKRCLEHDCMQWIQVMGTNPNNGQPVNEWGCAVAWMPILLIETTQQTRQAGAAIESFRNEMVRGNNQFLGFLTQNTKRHELARDTD